MAAVFQASPDSLCIQHLCLTGHQLMRAQRPLKEWIPGMSGPNSLLLPGLQILANQFSRYNWCLALQDIPNIIKHCRAPGPLYLSSLSEQELKLLSNMMQRLHNVAETAAKVS